jgi:hypothetical protein
MYQTTVANNTFLLNTDGFIVGTLYGKFPDRYAIEGGVVASTQATPLYGGLPLTLAVTAPTIQGSSGLGERATLATAQTNIDGWSVFDQGAAGIISGFSNVPLYYVNTSINFVRSGFLVLPVNPAAVNTIAGGASNQNIFWNFTQNYVDITGTGALGFQIIALSTNSKTVTYAAGPPITANWNGSGSVIVVKI